MSLRPKEWFEMQELRRRKLHEASWVPLCRSERISNGVPYGHLGNEEEFSGVFAVAFHCSMEEKALGLDWSDIARSANSRPWVEDGTFFGAGAYRSYGSDLHGEYLVLQLSFDGLEKPEWFLDQDIVLGLRLFREGDAWLCPRDDYIDVARIDRSPDGRVACLRIRTQYLQDYLCARASGLLVSTYQLRTLVVDEAPDFGRGDEYVTDEQLRFRWVGVVRPIHEGGFPFGEKIAVFHTARTSVDPEEDVPTIPEPSEDSFESCTWEKTHHGRRLFRVSGEMWRNHWVPPGAASPCVRGDHVEPDVDFITASSGKKLRGAVLEAHGGWLWFKGSVVLEMLSRRAGILQWYTRDTGALGHRQPVRCTLVSTTEAC